MHIKKITLENFKSYEYLEYEPNDSFNVIIGQNNIGKTTIFDSLLLWNMAFQTLITSNGKSFYQLNERSSKNISYNKLLILRIVNIADLFFDAKTTLSISLLISFKDRDFELKINFDSPPSIEDSYLRVKHSCSLQQFKEFADNCNSEGLKLSDIVSIGFTKPISFIEREETFLNKAQINKRSYLGRNYETLRNKVLNTNTNKRFEYLEHKLSNILSTSVEISYHNLNKDDEENIKISIKIGEGKAVDLSLVGSGILHMLEIFSSLYVKEKNEEGLNIILIDEPDSHIHSDLQFKIIDELKVDGHRQVFIISHNEKILNQSSLGEVFYINKFTKRKQKLPYIKITDFTNIKKDLGGKLYELELIEENKPILFVEGDSDKAILLKAFEYFDPTLQSDLIISPSGGYNGVKDNAIGWSFLNRDIKAIALFDYDNDCNKAISEVTGTVQANHIKILNLGSFKPPHILQIFQSKIQLPFAIEEMFSISFWQYFDSEGWLEEKKDLTSYNNGFSSMTQTFYDFCTERGVLEKNFVYFKKVKLTQKQNASSYLCSNATKDDFECLKSLVEKIREYIS